MNEIEPTQVFEGRIYEIQLTDDDEEEVTVRLRSNNSGITGIVGPLAKEEYPELFSGLASKKAIDSTARVIIQEILRVYSPDGLSVRWSDNFPIGRYFPYRGYINFATGLADFLRAYIEPTGEDGTLNPGDITTAIEKCLQDRIDPEIKVGLVLRNNKRMSRLASLWKTGEKEWEVEVDATDELEITFSEGHEAGHLLTDYFLKP